MLAGTEFWDRLSFHEMQALLLLSMVEMLQMPGHADRVFGLAGFRRAVEAMTGPLSTMAFVAQTVGLSMAFTFLMPILGGVAGNRLFRRRAAVTIGAATMTLGHFALTFDAFFLVGLALLTTGAGRLRANITAQLRSLYAIGDHREHDGFQFYYGAINLAAFVAPLVTGLLTQQVGWSAGFLFAGAGMLTGLLV